MSADTTEIATREQAGIAALEHVLGTGDLSQLSNEQRVGHYLRLCRGLGLNPLTRPFSWIEFQDGRLTLYANESCAAQLRRQHHMRVEVVRREVVGDLFCVEVKATTPDGREDFATKYVPLTNRYGKLTGQDYANALMKSETGAKRRVTLSMVGLAVEADEPDTGGWRPVVVDGTGMVVRHPTPEQRYLAETPTAARAIGEPVYEDAMVEDDPDSVSQAVRPDELADRPKRTGPRPTFRVSDEDVKRWNDTYHATVAGFSLEDDDERHRYVGQYTATIGWPAAKQTDSLATMLKRMTRREAETFLEHTRAVIDGEKAALLEHAAAAGAEPSDESGESF